MASCGRWPSGALACPARLAYRAPMNGPGFDRRMLRLVIIMATLGALVLAYGALHGVPR
jgi:hypothetical protein